MDETTVRRKPTIRDVAAAAGVSRGTVSRVINGGHWVSPDARSAVEDAIRRTGYTANHAARSLATGRSGSLAFLLTEPQHLLFQDPTFALLLRGAAEALAQRSMTLVLLVAGTPAERAGIATFVGAGHVDGVLLISSELDELLSVADRVLVLYRGRVMGTCPTAGADRARIGAWMAGHRDKADVAKEVAP